MKRIVAYILVCVMILGLVVISAAEEPSSWAKEEVSLGIESGLVPEELQKNYTTPITRGQISKMIINLLEKSMGKSVQQIIDENGATVNPDAFSDTDDSDILHANALGIINGTGNGKFSPDGTLKRAQIAAIINRIANVVGIDTKGFSHEFTDITDNYAWADSELGWPVEAGIIKGVGGSRFSPGGELTTEQTILIVTRALGPLTRNTATVYVSPSGSEKPDGTRENPYGSLEAARDAVRMIDKTDLDGIDVIVLPGQYVISDAVVFTKEDSGTENCRIRYIGKNGTSVFGGITLSAEDFSKADGDVTKFFREEAKNKIVKLDLKKYGFTPDDISNAKGSRKYRVDAPALFANGNRQEICRFPNDGWIYINGGMAIDYDGSEMPELTNTSEPEYYRIDYGEEYFDRVSSWTSGTKVFVTARWCFLWCVDDSDVMEFNRDKAEMNVRFAGGYAPKVGSIFYFYNIPEELDRAGEYYIDDDAVMYYYPSETFENDVFTIPVSKNLIVLNDADYMTFEGITLSTSEGRAFEATDSDWLQIKNCIVSAAGSDGIYVKGNNADISGNHIYDTVSSGIALNTGDIPSVAPGDSKIYNNLVEGWCSMATEWSSGISVNGVDALVSHNTIRFGNWGAIGISGVNIICEYNHAYKTNLMSDDIGVMTGGGKINANLIYRYNYIHDAGPGDIFVKIKEKNPDFLVMGIMGFYHDGGSSYINCYGNVVANTANGCLSNCGRNNSFTGNLFVNCSHWYVWASELGFDIIKEDGTLKKRTVTIPDYVYTDAWKAVNPELSKLIVNTEGADPDDQLLYWAPANIVLRNNWCHFNKSERYFSNWGVSPYNVEPGVYRYANEGDIDVSEGSRTNQNVSTYNSRRESYDLKELINETAKGVIEITWEEFEKIGNVKSDWKIPGIEVFTAGDDFK